MAMSQLDKMRLLGVIKKYKVNEYDDLYIDSRSKLTIYDFLSTSIDIAIKFIEEDSNEKYIINALWAVKLILLKILELELDEIPEEDIKNLLSLKKYEDKYSEDVKTLIKENVDTLSSIYKDTDLESLVLEEEEDLEPEMIDVTEEMEELERKLQEYEEKIKNLTNQLYKLNKNYKKREKDHEEKLIQLRDLKKEYGKTKKQLDSLKPKFEELNKKYAELKLSSDEQNRKIQILESENDRYKLHEKEYKKGYEHHIELEDQKEKNDQIEKIILEVLSERRTTLTDLIKTIKSRGIKVRNFEVSHILEKLKEKYEIDDSILLNFEKGYVITAKKVLEGRKFEMQGSRKKVRFLLISDPHFSNLSDNNYRVIDELYEYVSQRSIKTIVNCGDLLSYHYLSESTRLERMEYNDEILQRLVEEFPYSKDVKHLVLGGNHDMDILKYGIDPLKILEQNRDDFTSLGYNSAYFAFNPNNMLGFFHPDFRFVDDQANSQNLGVLYDYIDKTTLKNLVDKSKLYLSFFGHFHMAEQYEDIVICPSITRDRYQDGAWDVYVSLDSKGNIEGIELTKLNLINGHLLDGGKTEYVKKRTI